MALFKTKQERLDTQLSDAVLKNETGEVAMLLKKGANPNSLDELGATPLILATCSNVCNMAMIDILLDAGADAHYNSKEIGSPLTWAVIKRKIPEMEKFISLGADIESKDGRGNRPLHHAAANGSSEAIQLLLKLGADSKALNNDGQTPLYKAEKCEKRHAVALLKQHDARLIKQERLNDAPQWLKTGDSEVARVSQNAALEYQVTEIFNFSARKYTQIMRNLKTDAESQGVVFFDAYADKKLLAEARSELLKQNGIADEDSVRNVLIFKPATRG